MEIFLIDGETSRITRDWDRRSWHAHIRLFDRSITLERDDDDGQKLAAAVHVPHWSKIFNLEGISQKSSKDQKLANIKNVQFLSDSADIQGLLPT